MNLIANITLLVAALLDMIVLLGGDIADHRNNGHSNSKYYRWLDKSGEIMSLKRLLLLAVFVCTFTTMALQSWIVVMILAATLLIQGIYLLWRRQWKLLDDGKNARQMLFTAIFIVLCAIFGVGQSALRCGSKCPQELSGHHTLRLTRHIDGCCDDRPHHLAAHDVNGLGAQDSP